MKKFFFRQLPALLLAVTLLVSLTACQTAENKKDLQDSTAPTESAAHITLEIRCDETVPDSLWEAKELLPQTSRIITDGETALEALLAAAREENLSVVESFGYVTGISGLNATDGGASAGWMFTVNGELTDVGAAECKLADGDTVVWFFTVDFNRYFE